MNSILKKVLFSYARLHVQPPYLSTVIDQSLSRIRSFPIQYRLLTYFIFFITEFFYRFSTLSEKKALALILRLQQASHLPGRIFISLLKIPVLLSLKKEYLKGSL
ncbi:MAG: hypothetical protein A2Z91_09245 [Deltaproteobacteria bacterium GWA2_38_16]|nr:MAG: hypothetical protein A2Z91_09245 [Deltaproteobacteria bacterium GWA2_38_16]OGQ02518.1 MAG: hypothetical protein A3D19_09485 [Deltaproteobacteria bacterium RIFCSPHIGHO2_02_FULL_38_15]OGQ32174.1 MAG: hypothetical protein A3A72_06830 [Deltaproteobacteria bacterium RIFCSPLOWO2_01_FULL_38_9]OGQ60239.1 MAG: hypothetical protein A3G92_00665 [Deltaproteobacteria bacterium RIFCSPLOWO2_12_FULL_38_8]HBQ21026.1 hypothetical protein [Deltaproteobacteria bacterium]